MVLYLTKLNAKLEEEQQRQDECREGEIETSRERLTPLEQRLARLLATIPKEVQREGLSLPALQASLKGRWRGNCHPGELGKALRKLGFERRRNWRQRGASPAVWLKRD